MITYALTLRRLILIFWSVWFSLVFLTNLFDLLKQFRVVEPGWAVASGNLRAVALALTPFHAPGWLVVGLFLGVTAWEGIAAALFWRAWRAPGDASLRDAFGVSLSFWSAMLIADEALAAYTHAGAHMHVLIAQLVSLLAVHYLADRERS